MEGSPSHWHAQNETRFGLGAPTVTCIVDRARSSHSLLQHHKTTLELATQEDNLRFTISLLSVPTASFLFIYICLSQAHVSLSLTNAHRHNAATTLPHLSQFHSRSTYLRYTKQTKHSNAVTTCHVTHNHFGRSELRRKFLLVIVSFNRNRPY